MTNARTPRSVQLAMEHGFLDARGPHGRDHLNLYGLWCWRMALPMVRVERCSTRSRFSRVRLDLFTTPFRLTVAGQAELIALSAQVVPARYGSISTYEGEWTRVPNGLAAEFARSIFRAVRRPQSYELQRPAVSEPVGPRLAASA